jgi:phosphoribosylglycinamide formyltransferase-1
VSAFRIGVFASGGGSNLQSIMDRIRSGDLPAELSFVLSNNSKSGALARAREFGTAAYHVSAFTEGGEDKAAARILGIARSHRIDLAVLAGYMKLLPPGLLEAYRGRVVNIHPALLPAFGGAGFYGGRVHEAVLARGCQYSGITVHLVDEEYDQGQILLQRVVPVKPGWTAAELGSAVLEIEHQYYWQVIRAFAAGEIVPAEGPTPSRTVDPSRFLARLAHEDQARS